MNDLSIALLAAGLPDKRQVAVSFSRAAASYDSVAELQRAVGHELMARLPRHLNPQRWLDLGSGTGYFSRELGQRYAHSQGLALDIAQGMLAYARPLGGAQHFIAGDAESLPLQSNSCDVIFSSLALQWCADFRGVLSETQVKLLTNAGTANGRHRITPHSRRPGKLLRSSNQASDKPTTAQVTVTPTISSKVLRIRPKTKGRHNRWIACAHPACQALVPTYSNGNRLRPTRNSTGSSSQIEGLLRFRVKRAGWAADSIRASLLLVQAPALHQRCQGRPG